MGATNVPAGSTQVPSLLSAQVTLLTCSRRRTSSWLACLLSSVPLIIQTPKHPNTSSLLLLHGYRRSVLSAEIRASDSWGGNFSNKNYGLGARDAAQLAECLPSVVRLWVVDSAPQKATYTYLHRGFKASVGYEVRPCLKKTRRITFINHPWSLNSSRRRAVFNF